MTMNRKTTALAAGAVAAGVLAVGGWLGYQQWNQPREGHVLRGYDAGSPASTAPHTENVFTGRVAAFEEQRNIEGWTQDVYRVEVGSVLRGDLSGTVRVTYGLDEGPAARLKDGQTYVFATAAWTDPAKDGHAHLYQGEMKPVDDAQLAVWKKAATLPVAPQ
ncbi:hypothetical protein AB0E83_09525 [Streptomyces sp. NPDC035033]|uniref:hypothetical protein n=1 Tax=Streptomyces sp. NPDC035033 TaxID=3155368 RepID=UPI0033DC372E